MGSTVVKHERMFVILHVKEMYSRATLLYHSEMADEGINFL